MKGTKSRDEISHRANEQEQFASSGMGAFEENPVVLGFRPKRLLRRVDWCGRCRGFQIEESDRKNYRMTLMTP
jgi:hypothetical protein